MCLTQEIDISENKAVLVMRCKDCGYECITHKNGIVIPHDFIRVDNPNPFLRGWKCPKCNSDKQEYDHSKEDCGCNDCKKEIY